MTARGLLLILMLAATPAWPECLIFCGTGEVAADEAVPVFERDLRAPLPEGVVLTGMIDGGFQERFIQVRLTATEDGAAALLSMLNVAPEAMKPAPGRDLAFTEVDWWDTADRPDLTIAEARLGTFAAAWAARARDPQDPSRWLIYIAAHEM